MTTGNNNGWDPHNSQHPANQPQGFPPSNQPQGFPPGNQQPYPDSTQNRYGQQPPGGYPAPPQKSGGMKPPIIIGIAVVVLLIIGAVIFFLTQGDDENDNNTDYRDDITSEPETTEPPSSDPATTESETPTDEASEPSEEPSEDVQYGDPNADPAAFRQGLEEILEATGLTEDTAIEQGITAEQWDAYLSCVTDESLQRLTPEVIETISGGVDVYDSYSVSELEDIAIQCGTEVGTL